MYKSLLALLFLSLGAWVLAEETNETEERSALEEKTEPEVVEAVPEGYLRILLLIQGKKNPNHEFGTVAPLPYPLEISLQGNKEEEISLVSQGFAFQISGYRPIPAGKYELIVRSKGQPVARENMEIVEDDFKTLVVSDRNGRPQISMLQDVDFQDTPQGRQKVNTPRIRLGNFLPGTKISAASPALRLNAPLPDQEFQTLRPTQKGVFEMGVAGSFDGAPFTRVTEINLNQSAQVTVFVGEDLYNRPVVYLLPDAVLD
jgi:hypothetical protein